MLHALQERDDVALITIKRTPAQDFCCHILQRLHIQSVCLAALARLLNQNLTGFRFCQDASQKLAHGRELHLIDGPFDQQRFMLGRIQGYRLDLALEAIAVDQGVQDGLRGG